MPITSIGSYESTTLAFFGNWQQANTELQGNPLVLAGGYAIDNFEQDRNAMIVAINGVATLAQALRNDSALRDQAKLDLIARHKQFRGTVLGQIIAADYLAALPTAPPESVDKSKFMAPLNSAILLWTRINANASVLGLTAPLTLQGGFTLAQFQAAVTALGTLYDATANIDDNLSFARADRDNKLAAIYERMKQYRALLPSQLPKTSPAVQNLPRLSPAPGTTPPPLVIAGAWDAVITKARLTWPASTAPNVEKLQVRGCTGGSYKAGNEEIVGDLAANATHWEGDWGLTVPGSIATFKVYVMTTTGNENGGKAVKIVRPAT